jgi:hypothetical protein
MTDDLLAFDNHGMTGIVSALKPNHKVGVLGQQVDDLAFALIAPLGANDYKIGHSLLLYHWAFPTARRSDRKRK